MEGQLFTPDDGPQSHPDGVPAREAPLAVRLRPRTVDEVVGQQHLLGDGTALRRALTDGRPHSMILYGPPGTGKTTLARLVAGTASAAFEELSAVEAGRAEVRQVRPSSATHRRKATGEPTVFFLDEIHRFNKAQQDLLLPAVEEGLVTLIGATTENPYFEVNGALLSRSTLFRLEPLDRGALHTLLQRGLEAEAATIEEDAADALVGSIDGDGRALLTTLEVASAIAGERRLLTLDDIERARTTRALTWGRDDHYDVVSALIKSIRGSDPNASLHWLARMIVAGEDPRYIARRLVILASEDIGMADPTSLLIATAAAHAVEYVGLPEAQLNLAQAVVHLANAPKSNRTTLAISKALDDVRSRPAGPVPAHLRDAHYKSAERIGHGVGYKYPHEDPRGWVEQEYLPETLAGIRYYEPSEHGAEAEISERLRRRVDPR